MRIAVLGTGQVGSALASRFVELGHEVMMGSRSVGNEKATRWAAAAGDSGSSGTFADAARHGEVVVNATAGTASLAALESAGADALRGKVLLDVANPIAEFGPPMRLDPVDDDSLGEQIQRAFPEARVVKALNTINVSVMVHPESLPGEHDVFIAGDDNAAKDTVRSLLGELGWPEASMRDLGGIEAARAAESYLLLWIRLTSALGRYDINVHVVT